MNCHLMKAVSLYARIKKKKRTGTNYKKMRRVLAMSRKLKTDSPAEISMTECVKR